MSRDKEPESHQGIAGEIQDYLDLLLSPAASEDAPTELEQTASPVSAKNKTDIKLSMVGGTAYQQQTSAVAKKSTLPNATVPPSAKPFAEPPKPVMARPLLTAHLLKPEPKASQINEPVVEPDLPMVKAKTDVESELPSQVPTVPEVDVRSQDLQSAGRQGAREKMSVSKWLDNGRPEWAQQRFECLLFTVGGLTLAVPLVELGTIFPLEHELTPLFGQAKWFMGLLNIKGQNIRTVNTAKIVMPERYLAAMDEHYQYVITINDVDWGLAVDTVASAITLEPEDVRWRSERGKRPWLAGTVVEHMCALLDVSQLAAMFVAEDKNA